MDNTLTTADLQQIVTVLENHIALRQEAAKQRDLMEAAVQEHTAQIKGHLAVLGVKRFEGSQYIANFITQKRETISKTKLVAKGVSADLIAECVDVNEVEQLRITKKG